jgi:hypothetical protein
MHGCGWRAFRCNQRIGWMLVWPVLLAAGPDGFGQQSAPAGQPHAPPFKRAMIFSGLGTDFVSHIGAYDAALDAGYPPDLIIGTSGGAIAAAIVAAFPDRAGRKEFLSGPAFHDLMLSYQIERSRPGPLLAQFGRWQLRACGIGVPPHSLFVRPLATLASKSGVVEFERPFPIAPGCPRIIMVAAEIRCGAACQGRSDKKQFIETFFTDQETAAHLADAASPIGTSYPRSAVAEESKAISGVSIEQALRASVSEPYMFIPARVNGHHYTGGVIDLSPVEIAALLACETIVPKQPGLDRIAETMVASVFLYSQRERRLAVEQLPVRFRVDMADQAQALKDSSFWLSARLVRNEAGVQAVAPGNCKRARTYLIPRWRIVDGVPQDPSEFQRCINAHWQYGYDRAKQAFAPH